jgi:membrane fusion protein (multidrug efflux system)
VNAYQKRAVPYEDLEKKKAEAKAWEAEREALSFATFRIDQERLVEERKTEARLAELEQKAVQLNGEVATEEDTILRLKHEVQMRVIRAPVCGRVGEVAEFRVGSVARTGDRLGVIVPETELRAAALFSAASAGRIRTGQAARLRLQSYPWTQYGTLAARVVSVGSEPSDGLIRVEFTLAADQASRIPVGHGLQGSAEVEIEQVSPAILVLRAAGQLLAATPSRGDNTSQRGAP